MLQCVRAIAIVVDLGKGTATECCSALQYVAPCCRVVQCVAARASERVYRHCPTMARYARYDNGDRLAIDSLRLATMAIDSR